MEKITTNENQQEISQPLIKKHWYKKWWAILIFGFLLYFLLISLLLLTAPTADDSTTNSSAIEQQTIVGEETLYVNSFDDPQIGNREAAVRIVEFSDFQCPFCREAFSTVREIISLYGDKIYFVYRDFPISDVHPLAQKAAEAAQCAHEQGKFWPMHDKIFINQENLSLDNLALYASEVGLEVSEFNYCLNSNKYQQEVSQDLFDGQILGVDGTPTFFINGYRIGGVIPRDIFISLVEQGLAE